MRLLTVQSMSTAGALARSAKWRKVMLGQRWYEDWEAASSSAATSSSLALNWVVHCRGRDPALLLKGSLGGVHMDAGFRRQQVPQKWWRLFWAKTQYGAVVSPVAATSKGKDYYEIYLPQRSNDGSKLLDAVVSTLPRHDVFTAHTLSPCVCLTAAQLQAKREGRLVDAFGWSAGERRWMTVAQVEEWLSAKQQLALNQAAIVAMLQPSAAVGALTNAATTIAGAYLPKMGK